MIAHRDALPVIRMQADVQNQGYAAGVASARSAATGQPLRQLDIRDLQQHLVEIGILEAEVLGHEDSFPLPAKTIAAALEAGPVDHFNAAVLVAHRKQTGPGLLNVLATTSDPDRRESAAMMLGLFGRAEAVPVLAKIVTGEPWDEGWNYTGMGQFGRSMSRMDGLIVALGKTRSLLSVAPVQAKIEAMDASAAFSDCRAASIAASALGAPCLAHALARLRSLSGVTGNAHLDTADVIRCANDDHLETEARNLSLRELLLGRGLYLCGDVNDIGYRILNTYARDLRGHYARHAQAVLATRDLSDCACP